MLQKKRTNNQKSFAISSRKKRLVITGVLLAILAVTAISLFVRSIRAQHSASNALTAVTVPTATICAVGDISINDDVLAAALQPDGSYDFTSCFLQVAPLLSAADLTIGNLELSFSGAPYGGANHSAPDGLADTLQTVGFDLLQTANSKSIAGGISGLRATLRVLEERRLDSLGTYASEEDRAGGSAILKEINGIRIAFLGFTKGFDGMSLPADSEYCADILYTDYDTVYSDIAETAILDAIQDAKDLKPDIIIAMLHWGSENTLSISNSQEDTANLMFKAGVDVILGSHSHIVGPMEYRTVTRDDDSEATVFFAASLGNFLGFSGDPYTTESVILNLKLEKDLADETVSIADASYVPVYLTTSDSTSGGQCLDVYQSIDLYNAAYLDRVDEESYEALLDTIEILKTNTNSKFDRGPETTE